MSVVKYKSAHLLILRWGPVSAMRDWGSSYSDERGWYLPGWRVDFTPWIWLKRKLGGVFHRSRNGFSFNEGGLHGFVLVVHWSGFFAPHFDFAVRLPRRWIGCGWYKRPYLRGHVTGTWKI